MNGEESNNRILVEDVLGKAGKKTSEKSRISGKLKSEFECRRKAQKREEWRRIVRETKFSL